MANEPYIKRLEREKEELIQFVRCFEDWKAALEFANTTGRKGDAFKVVDEKRYLLDEQRHIIEPLLAEGGK